MGFLGGPLPDQAVPGARPRSGLLPAMGVLALTLHSAGYTWSFMAIDGQSFMDTGDADCH
jgi:hypothetical protein